MVMFVPFATPVASESGTWDDTPGGVVSAADVNVEVNTDAMAFPDASVAPV